MNRVTVFSNDVLYQLIAGVSLPTRAIRSSYGPQGRGVMLHRPPAVPEILFDGASIAREVLASGPVERQASYLLKEFLFDMDRDFGDGTSTLAIISDAILRIASPIIQAGGNAAILSDALINNAAQMAENLKAVAKNFDSECHIGPTVRSALKGELSLAQYVIDLDRRLGHEGQILVREATGRHISVKYLPGMTLPVTHASEAFRRDPVNSVDGYIEPWILLVDEKINDLGKLILILEGFAKNGKSLVVVCHAIQGMALTTLAMNIREAGLRATAVALPDVSFRNFDLLRDISILSGGAVISGKTGTSLKKLKPHMLGRLDRVEIRSNSTTFIGNAVDQNSLLAQQSEIRAEIDRGKYLSLDRERAEARLARLSGGIGELHVGGFSTADQKRNIMLFNKASSVLKAAKAGGVLPGNGEAYKIATGALNKNASGIDQLANSILTKALHAPAICLSADHDNSYTKLLQRDPPSVIKHSIPSLLDEKASQSLDTGVYDPLPIVTAAISRAVSFAAAILRCDLSIVQSKRE